MAGLRRAYGRRQAVGLSVDSVLTAVRYGDQHSVDRDGADFRLLNFECPDLAQMKNPPTRLLFDEISQRVVVMDATLSHVLTLRTVDVCTHKRGEHVSDRGI